MGTKQTEDTSERDGTSRRRNRRQALALGGVAAAAAAVAVLGRRNDAEAAPYNWISADADATGRFVNTGDGHGIRVESSSGHGVRSESARGGAVVGTGWSVDGNGVGVEGQAPGDSPGVRAWSGVPRTPPDGGLALEVVGKAMFSTAGAGVVPAKAYTEAVPNPAVTADSHITVTLTDDPGRASVAWVERDPGTGFTVHMSSRVRSAVPFTYLIVEQRV